jgi:hypothetical protein
MRLLKFTAADAPNTSLPLQWNTSDSTLRSSASQMRWKGVESKGPSSSFLLLTDDGQVVPISGVIALTPDGSSVRMQQVSDAHIADLDFRNKAGKKLDASKLEYGRTYAKAQAKPVMMNADSVREKRNEYNKREREAVAEAIEKGEKYEKQGRLGKKARGEGEATAAPPAATPAAAAESKPVKSALSSKSK